MNDQSFRGDPCNKFDRRRFSDLNPDAQNAVRARASVLYDGTRTLSRCWTIALDEAAD